MFLIFFWLMLLLLRSGFSYLWSLQYNILFSLYAFEAFSLSQGLSSLVMNVPWGSFWLYSLLSFLDMWVYSFYQLWKMMFHYFFKYFFFPLSHFLYFNYMYVKLLVIVSKGTEALFIFSFFSLILDSVYCCIFTFPHLLFQYLISC